MQGNIKKKYLLFLVEKINLNRFKYAVITYFLPEMLVAHMLIGLYILYHVDYVMILLP